MVSVNSVVAIKGTTVSVNVRPSVEKTKPSVCVAGILIVFSFRIIPLVPRIKVDPSWTNVYALVPKVYVAPSITTAVTEGVEVVRLEDIVPEKTPTVTEGGFTVN
jgi:hypothetical protein